MGAHHSRRIFVAGGASLLAAPAFATQPAGQNAASMIAAERAAAAAENKRLFIVFWASWCSWCRLLDRMLEEPASTRILGSRFRILHVRVLERREEMRAQEWAGVNDVFLSYTGGNARMGLPFMVFLDDAGAVVTHSAAPLDGTNMGFPVTPEELDGFEAMIATAAPDTTTADRRALRRACVRYAP